MAILDDVLKEEYDRLNRMESAYQKELSILGDAAKGSVRMKPINGKRYPYRQYREGDRIKSDFIPKENLSNVQSAISRRKELQDGMKRLKAEKKRLEKMISHG